MFGQQRCLLGLAWVLVFSFTPAALAQSNLLVNPGFEEGLSPWLRSCPGNGDALNIIPAVEGCTGDLCLEMDYDLEPVGWCQVYQPGLNVLNDTSYELCFDGRSELGSDVYFDVIQQSTPFTPCGLPDGWVPDLTPTMERHCIRFTSVSEVDCSNARLRTNFMGRGTIGDKYYFDQFELCEGSCSPCGPGANLEDRDGNGLDDYACVADWNENGICEMEQDLQLAIDLLDDPGDKLVELGNCEFMAPIVATDFDGIITLPSNIVLQGQRTTSVLNGFASDDTISRQAVITNDDHQVGNSNIVVRDLTIDGGWLPGDTSVFANQHRMGVFLDGCSDCRVERVTVRDTLHTCLYSRNGTNVQFLDSTLRRCGNYEGTGNTFSCAYVFAESMRQQLQSTIRGIDCDGSGGPALNTRRADASGVLSDVVFENNVVRNTGLSPLGAARPCITVRGVTNATYRNNECYNTGGLVTPGVNSFYDAGLDSDAVSNVLVDGLLLDNTVQRTPLQLYRHLDGFTGRNITVQGSDYHCAELEMPQLGLVLEDITLTNCRLRGINVLDGVTDDVDLTLSRVEIVNTGLDGVAREGIRFAGLAKNAQLTQLTVRQATGNGLSFKAGADNVTLLEPLIDGTGGHGLDFEGPAQSVRIEDGTFNAISSDGIHWAGNAAAATFSMVDVLDTTFSGIGNHSIATGSLTPTIDDFEIRGNQFNSSERSAVFLDLDPGLQSPGLHVSDNTVADFGLAGQPDYGIDIRGNLQGEQLLRNDIQSQSTAALGGLRLEVSDPDASQLCTTTCGGTIDPTECVVVPAVPAFGMDLDGDGITDACESCADEDLDGVCDSSDNCPLTFNTIQSDQDLDGQGDACDIDDGQIYLRFTAFDRLEWADEVGIDAWNVYRGSLPWLRSSGEYTQPIGTDNVAQRTCDSLPPLFIDASAPPAGFPVFFLVTGQSGGVELDLGQDSSGATRMQSNPCPDS